MLFKQKVIIIFSLATFFSCTETKEYTHSDLVTAIQENNIEQIDIILNSGIEINTLDTIGNSVLILAVQNNNKELTQHLLSKGADPNLINSEELTPLAIARKNENNEISDIIKDFQYHDWLKQEDKFTEEAFEYAIDCDNPKIVVDFIKNGRDVEEVCISKGIAPLIHAIFTDSYNVIKILLENNANPNVSFDTRPAITISAMFNQYEVTKMLIEKGADINAVDGPLTSALMFASEEGNIDLVKLLIENGADSDLVDQKNETAKDKAIKNNYSKIVELLSK